jgi:hypothetical protein
MHHYMRTDVLESLAAIALYPLLLVTPGYTIGWLADVFGFRRRTPAFRAAVSIPLSISICPILIYLLGRFLSLGAAEAFFVLTWVGFAVLLAGRRVGWPRIPRAAWCIVLAWFAISLFISVDVQIGVKDYYPVTAFDYAVRSEFIHSIATTGIPPANPFFFPGHAVPLRYHYFWLLLPSLMYRTTGYAIGTRAAWIGSVFWCGLGFLSVTALAFRLFWYRGEASFRRRAITGMLLLGVTGLDIIPTAFLWLLRATGMMGAVLPSLEWWNDQVDGFVYTAVWEAHHLSGLIACILALLLIHYASEQTLPGRRFRHALIAGLAVAGSVGASIYIALVFAAYLLLWTVIVAAKRWWRTLTVLVMTGAASIVLGLPYMLSQAGWGAGAQKAAANGPLLQFRVRQFYPIYMLLRTHGATAAGIVDTLVLPLNYFLELGFFFGAGILWWQRRRRTGKSFSQNELAVALLVAVSVVICTFVRSSVIGNNDLGWRGFLLAQFGLLLWSVDVLLDRPRHRVLSALLVLGAAGTFYDACILRLYPVLADAGVVRKIAWMASDRQLGARN